jgi:hypothetical protein
MTPEERFARIEELLGRYAEGIASLSENAVEMEAAQKNLTRTLDRFIDETKARFADVAEQLDNSRILLDRLIRRDIERGEE